MTDRARNLTLGLIAGLLLTASAASAQTLQAPFDSAYAFTDLGEVPGLPSRYGGLTFLDGDPNTILICGDANESIGALYTIGVTRDADDHVVGFTGTATKFADATFCDGGLEYGPGNVLFYAQYNKNKLGQIKPGSTAPDKVIDLDDFDVGNISLAALNFVPAGFPGAGQLKLVTYPGGDWYTAEIGADGAGTFDIVSVTNETQIVGGPEGFIYPPPGSPQLPTFDSMLVSEWGDHEIAAYDLDAGGNPIPASRATFLEGFRKPEGAKTDPVTGDFLFSTFDSAGNRVVVIQGFAVPGAPGVTPTPTPTNTPTPTVTSTPAPGDTTTPTMTPTVTVTPTPTVTPTATPSPEPVLDHFKCYGVSKARGEARFEKREVLLTDEFGTKLTIVQKPAMLCTPVDKNGEGIHDPTAHLSCYKIKDAKGQPKRRRSDVRVENQFGEETLRVSRANVLCLPSTRDGVPSVPNLDHFKCYKGTNARGTAKFQRRDLTLADAFETKLHQAKRPGLFCNAVDKDREGILDPGAHLECYDLRRVSKRCVADTPSDNLGDRCRNEADCDGVRGETVRCQKQEKLAKRVAEMEDQFGIFKQQVKAPRMVCVPTERLD